MAGHALSKGHFLGFGLGSGLGVFASLAASLDAALRWNRERGTGCVREAGAVVMPRTNKRQAVEAGAVEEGEKTRRSRRGP